MHTLDQQTGHRELPGEKVIVSLLNTDNQDAYLDTYKTASSFAAIYEKSEDVWEHMHRYFGTDKDFAVRYLILEKDTNVACGFLNYENQGGNPALDIAITPAYRQKGYGSDAARTLCHYLLSQDDVEKIIWNVLPSNTASVRIAEKLGGKQIPWPDMISEAFDAAFGDMPGLDNLPSTITYAITQIENRNKTEKKSETMWKTLETIGKLESGKYNPSLKLAMDIAKVFGTTVEEIFYFEDDDE